MVTLEVDGDGSRSWMGKQPEKFTEGKLHGGVRLFFSCTSAISAAMSKTTALPSLEPLPHFRSESRMEQET